MSTRKTCSEDIQVGKHEVLLTECRQTFARQAFVGREMLVKQANATWRREIRAKNSGHTATSRTQYEDALEGLCG